MTRIASLAAVVLTLAACGSIQPLPGDYTITSATPTVDTCGLAEDANLNDEEITLTIVEDAIHVDVGDSDEIGFDCAMEKNDLVCDDFEQVQDAGDEADAVLTLAWTFGGTFVDEATIDPAELSLDYACEGADCTALAADAEITLPCQTSFDLTIMQ